LRSAVRQPELVADVGNEIGKRRVHARQVLAREPAAHRRVGPHAEKHRVVIGEQPLEGQVGADLAAEAELDSHTLHDLAARLDHLFLQLERRNAKGEQPADARVTVEHYRLHAVTHQDVGAAEPGGPGSHHRDAPARGPHVRHVGLPAALQRLVGDVLLDRADGDGT
jgi:hypothetical protein